MTATLEELQQAWTPISCEFDPNKSYELLQLAIGTQVPSDELEDYYELIELIVDSIFHGFGGGTVSTPVASALLKQMARDWDKSPSDQTQASMLSVVARLLPRPEATEWLRRAARGSDSATRALLQRYLDIKRDAPVV